jgi:hypothetical protein
LSIQVIALDLERTLIDNALSAWPRPGLFDFLAFCHANFKRVALFTTVAETDAREVLEELNRSGHIPPGLLTRLEYVAWCGEYKDLRFISDAVPDEVMLVDDDASWVRPDQRNQWVPIAVWDGGEDSELQRVRSVLAGYLKPRNATDNEPVNSL